MSDTAIMREFGYPARFTRDKEADGFVVTFRDVPEAITQGGSRESSAEAAAGALQAALEGRILSNLEIPRASAPKSSERMIAVPVQTALKAALYLEMRETGTTRVELARRLGIHEREARRMLDPYHPTKADRLEQALASLGKHVLLSVG
jgi:antitoxin HicB